MAKANRQENSVVTFDMSKLKLPDLHNIASVKHGHIVLKADRTSVTLDMNDSFDRSILNRFEEFSKIITSSHGATNGVALNETVFSKSDAGFILGVIKNQQNEQKQKGKLLPPPEPKTPPKSPRKPPTTPPPPPRKPKEGRAVDK